MVQLEPNLALTLKNLAAQGAVVSTEQQVCSCERGQATSQALIGVNAQLFALCCNCACCLC